MKKQDLAVAAYLVAAFVMMIIPIPSWLLDILLACNIALGFTILFTAMFAKEVLDMSFFPTILLFTTIFRIALNISSTRLILTTGDPGEVVQTFGNYVGGGDLIVGAIVFLILIIVQFMIINKGSERVAEVTARFTLDAMPGKQMAIDADLNTGAINDAEAKRRRDKIQEEASFFGSMDGAVKYVKGDATAGLIITAVNIVGGIAMGVLRRGMDFNRPRVYGWSGSLKILLTSPYSISFPAYMTMTSSAISATTPISWVISIRDLFSFSFSSLINSRIWAWIVTSRAVVGSSAMNSDALQDSAMAIMTR